MKQLISISIFSLFSCFSFGQEIENLVPNGSFESISKAPRRLGSIESATGWYSPTGERADLFYSNKKYPDIGSPSNLFGKEDAKDGTNYAGIIGYSHNDTEPRTYVATKLSTTLEKGQKYCVKMYISMAEASTYAANQIGIHFSKKAFGTEEEVSIIEKTHVLGSDNDLYNASYGWYEICATYIAEGNEKYITIGNFTSNENTKNKRNRRSSIPRDIDPVNAAYYYVDNIVVSRVSEETPCECEEKDPTAGYSKTIFQKAINFNDKMTFDEKVESLSLYFGFGKTDITKAADEALTIVVDLLKANPNVKIQINGFSDKAEDEAAMKDTYFKGMDSKRVSTVYNYLVENGIGETRIIASPQGSATPSADILESDEDDLKQAKNRRIEFVIRK